MRPPTRPFGAGGRRLARCRVQAAYRENWGLQICTREAPFGRADHGAMRFRFRSLPSPFPLSFPRRAACACACSLPSQPSVAGESPRCRIARVATTASLLAMSRGFSVHSHLARGQSRTMARSFAHLTCRPLHEASTRPSQGINGHFLQLRLAPSWPMSFLSFLRQQSMVPSPNVDVDIRPAHWRPLSRVQANFLSALDPTGSSRPGCLRRMLAVAHCHYLRR